MSGPISRPENPLSLYAIGAMQGLLCIFLLVAAYQSYVMFKLRFPQMDWQFRFGVPLVTCFVALAFLRALVGNVRRALELRKTVPPKPPAV